jgi:hypothetical protein
VRRPTGDDGQIMILSIGFTIVALLLVTGVVSATGIHLERKRLLAAADSIAVEAADELSAPGYFPARFEGFRVLDATSDDGRSAHVRLGALARPPLISWVTAPWSDGIALEADSSARAW